jgi:segregation and condensation protein B
MNELTRRLEALLFVAEDPLSLERLAELADSSTTAVTEALDELDKALAGHGLCLSHHDNGYRLVSAPQEAESVRRLLEGQAKAELSRPALETLSIIAYRGPISRSGIEAIRGVGSEITLRGLISRELIVTAGKAKEPGRPPLYAVSPQFLDLFGLSTIDQLPPLEDLPDAP